MLPQKNSGFSLVELLIATFITGIVVMGAYNFLERTQRSSVKLKAKQEAKTSIDLYSKFMLRDLKNAAYGEGDVMTLEDDGRRLDIKRYKTEEIAGELGTLTVSFQNQCVELPEEIREPYIKIRARSESTIFAADNVCLNANRCPEGQYESVSVSTDSVGTGVPVYHPSQLPKFKDGMTINFFEEVLGASFCVKRNSDMYTVAIEGIYATGSKLSNAKARVIKKVIQLRPFDNKGVRILPTRKD